MHSYLLVDPHRCSLLPADQGVTLRNFDSVIFISLNHTFYGEYIVSVRAVNIFGIVCYCTASQTESYNLIRAKLLDNSLTDFADDGELYDIEIKPALQRSSHGAPLDGWLQMMTSGKGTETKSLAMSRSPDVNSQSDMKDVIKVIEMILL